MTFFLRDGALPDVAARGVDTPIPSFWGGVSASFRKEQIETNASFRVQNMMQEERRGLSQQVIDASQGEVVRSYYGERGLDLGEDLEAAQRNFMMTPDAQAYALKFARDRGLSVDTSEDAIERRVNERLAKEYKDATDTLGASSGGAAALIGGIAGQIWDARQLPFIFGGGGGSILRVMGREAMLNVAAEGVTLPSRYGMAERLNIPDPDVPTTLAMAAVGGAALGGAMEGLARGITYWRGTRGAPSERVAGYDVEMNVDVAEDAIADGARVFDVVPERIRETPKAPERVVLSGGDEADLAPRGLGDGAVPSGADTAPARQTDGAVAAGTDMGRPISPRLAEEALSDLVSQPVVRTEQADLDDLISRAVDDDPLPPAVERRLTSEAGGSRPLINHIQNRYGGVSPSSRLGQELRAMGVAPKDAPGLFRKAGAQGFDNIPVAEEPHLAQVLGNDGNGYLAEDSLASAIADEIAGRPLPVSREQHAARIELDERRVAQEEQARATAIGHARELDDALFRMPDLPGWDDVRVREAVDAHASAELRSQAEASGPFGPILTQFQGRPDDAIEELKRLQAGDAVGALHHPHIGPIDLVWGDAGAGRSGHGLAKIIRKHPEVMDDLQGRLSSSTTVLSESENRYRLTNGLDIFVVAKEFKGTPKRWLLTAYEQVFDEAGNAQRSIGRRMGRAGGLPEGSSPSAPLPSKDSPSASVLQEDRVLPEEIEMRRAAEERPGTLVDMGDGKGERPLLSVLDELDADADFAAVIALCGRPM